MWDCAQEYLQDTRDRHDPRQTDVPATMGQFSRRDRRENFNAKLRGSVPEMDEDA